MLASHVNLTESCQVETMCLLEGPLGNPGCIFLIGDYYGWTQLTVGEAIAGLVVLEALRTQAEQATKSKPENSALPWFLP